MPRSRRIPKKRLQLEVEEILESFEEGEPEPEDPRFAWGGRIAAENASPLFWLRRWQEISEVA